MNLNHILKSFGKILNQLLGSKMKNINKIKFKIEKIEKLLEEVKSELDIFEEDTKKKKSNKSEIIPDRKELISEYNNLYQNFLSGNSDIISSFFTNKSIKYLKEFCRVNNVSIDSTKQSKAKIKNEIIRWFQQRKAISKRNK